MKVVHVSRYLHVVKAVHVSRYLQVVKVVLELFFGSVSSDDLESVESGADMREDRASGRRFQPLHVPRHRQIETPGATASKRPSRLS